MDRKLKLQQARRVQAALYDGNRKVSWQDMPWQPDAIRFKGVNPAIWPELKKLERLMRGLS